jgi:hypothetical protein
MGSQGKPSYFRRCNWQIRCDRYRLQKMEDFKDWVYFIEKTACAAGCGLKKRATCLF